MWRKSSSQPGTYLKEKCPRKREEQVQRPRGGNMLGVCFVHLLWAQSCPSPWPCALIMLLPFLLQLPRLYITLLPSPHWSSKLLPPRPDSNPTSFSLPYCPHLCSHYVLISITIIITSCYDCSSSVSSQLAVISFRADCHSSLYTWCLARAGPENCWLIHLCDISRMGASIETGSRLETGNRQGRGGEVVWRVLNVTELDTLKWLKCWILCYVNFATIKKNVGWTEWSWEPLNTGNRTYGS